MITVLPVLVPRKDRYRHIHKPVSLVLLKKGRLDHEEETADVGDYHPVRIGRDGHCGILYGRV